MKSKNYLVLIIIIILLISGFLIYQNKWQGKKITLNNNETNQSSLNLTNSQPVEKPTLQEQKKIEKISLPDLETPEQAQGVIENWIKNQPTYKFDGQNLSLKEITKPSGNLYRFLYNFETKNSGYGNRLKQNLDQEVTRHLVEITAQNNRVLYALIDGRWDEVEQKMIR